MTEKKRETGEKEREREKDLFYRNRSFERMNMKRIPEKKNFPQLKKCLLFLFCLLQDAVASK